MARKTAASWKIADPSQPLRGIAGALALSLLAACGEDDAHEADLVLGTYTYPYPAALSSSCSAGEKPGETGRIDDYLTAARLAFNLRTPANYHAEFRHPLIVVFAPGGHDRGESEALVHLTRAATEAGFLIAYVDDHPLSLTAFDDFAALPRLIARRWCVDEDRYYLTGHSNGGLVTNAVAFMESTRDVPAAIAPSAGGIGADDFAAQTCPAPISVMVMHGARDTLFPGYGKAAAVWWAACNRCDGQPSAPREDGCIAYTGCAEDIETLYCEADTSHTAWPALNESIIQFFADN